jgi:hypothetical protein
VAEDGVKAQLAATLVVGVVGHIAKTGEALGSAGMESQQVERGEQSGRAVAFAIVRHVAQAPLLLRQAWLGARTEDRIGWAIDMEADDIPELVGEQGIVRAEGCAPVSSSRRRGQRRLSRRRAVAIDSDSPTRRMIAIASGRRFRLDLVPGFCSHGGLASAYGARAL